MRPRFKDLFDLLHLLRHASFTPEVREQALASLAEECRADRTDLNRLNWLLAGQLGPLFTKPSLADSWASWRHNNILAPHWQKKADGTRFYYFDGHAKDITDPLLLPESLHEFAQLLHHTFVQVGFEQSTSLTGTDEAVLSGTAAQLSPAKPSSWWASLRGLFGR